MVLVLKDKLTEIVLGSYLGDKKACPSLTSANRFLEKSAVELARSIRSGEITSTQLVQAVIDRIKEVIERKKILSNKIFLLETAIHLIL